MAEPRAAVILVLAILLVGPGCRRRGPPRAEAIGEGYVAPETLNLRREIALDSGAVATVKRSERVEILQRRRRFVKVRTAAKQEGWTEQSQLLTPEVYQQIDQMARRATRLPSLGVYRARDKLNVHMEPYRWSPGIYQLKEEEKVTLLGRRVTERTAAPPTEPQPPSTVPTDTAKSRATDEWYLIRTLAAPEPRAGWVLARMTDADIPDEVAQYAEGRRITSYFPLGEVIDGGRVKKIWLWTTVERGNEAYDFDYVRIFNWGRRRHHYETAYKETRLKGFFPVTVSPRVETRFGTGPGFSIIIEKNDGQRYLRRYVMIGYNVRRYAEEPIAAAPSALETMLSHAEAPPASKAQPQPGVLRRLWNRLRGR